MVQDAHVDQKAVSPLQHPGRMSKRALGLHTSVNLPKPGSPWSSSSYHSSPARRLRFCPHLCVLIYHTVWTDFLSLGGNGRKSPLPDLRSCRLGGQILQMTRFATEASHNHPIKSQPLTEPGLTLAGDFFPVGVPRPGCPVFLGVFLFSWTAWLPSLSWCILIFLEYILH